MEERCWCLPNDYIIFVDYVSQGAVFNGIAVAYDDTSSAFKAVDKRKTHTHTHNREFIVSVTRSGHEG